jgi:hypothetical protein
MRRYDGTFLVDLNMLGAYAVFVPETVLTLNPLEPLTEEMPGIAGVFLLVRTWVVVLARPLDLKRPGRQAGCSLLAETG